jgi:WD40 repeat protein
VCCWAEFSPDGSVIASDVFDDDRPVRLWNIETGERLNVLRSGGPLAFTPDGTGLWVGSCVVTWRTPRDGPERCLDTSDVDRLRVDSPFISDVSLSLDGSRVATAHSNGTVVVWNAQTLQPLATLVEPFQEIRDIELSPEGTRLAMGLGDGTARIWDLALTGGAETLVLAGHNTGIQSMKFSPDGMRLATASEDGTVNLWDVSPQGGGDWTEPASRAVAYSPDGRTLAVGNTDGSVSLFDVPTRRLVRSFPSRLRPHSPETFGPTAWLRWGPSGDRIASVGPDGIVSVWDTNTGETLLTLDAESVFDVAFSPDGRRLATTPDGGLATIWDASTGEALWSVQGVHSAIAFSPDGKLVAAPYNPGFRSTADEIRIWDAESGALLHTLDVRTFAWALAFSPDGSRLIEGGFEEGLRQWDTADWKPLPTISASGLGRLSGGFSFSPDGTQIATASQTGVRLWDLQTRRVIVKLTGLAASDVSFSPDGIHLAATTVDERSTVYALSVDELLRRARSLVTRDFTDQECRQYLHLAGCLRTSSSG